MRKETAKGSVGGALLQGHYEATNASLSQRGDRIPARGATPGFAAPMPMRSEGTPNGPKLVLTEESKRAHPKGRQRSGYDWLDPCARWIGLMAAENPWMHVAEDRRSTQLSNI